MKVVILAGGLGTRLSEETLLKPKPMVNIGEYPILWHIMKIYSHYGFNDFILLCGYKASFIKEYFLDYHVNNSDITIDMSGNAVQIHESRAEPWKITILNTGLLTGTGSRIKKAADYILGNKGCQDPDPYFSVTYGDGVSNVDLREVIKFHREKGQIATLTAVQPSGRFGALNIDESSSITNFEEKPAGDGNWVNGGFFILDYAFLDLIPKGDDIMLEQEPMRALVERGQLNAYKHHGFWKPMDTLRDKTELNALWSSGKAPWKIWE